MSRVERTEIPNERREAEPRRQSPRRSQERRTDSPGHTPGQAEGDEHDVEEALQHQSE